MASFIKREAHEGGDGDADDDVMSQHSGEDEEGDGRANVSGLIGKVKRSERDKEGHHLKVMAKRRLEDEANEEAELERAAERYQLMARHQAARESSGSGSRGGGGGLHTVDSELSEMAYAAKAAALAQQKAEATAARAAAKAEAARREKAKAAERAAMAGLFEMETAADDDETPLKRKAAASSAATSGGAVTSRHQLEDGELPETSTAGGGSAAEAPSKPPASSSSAGGKFRIKKKKIG